MKKSKPLYDEPVGLHKAEAFVVEDSSSAAQDPFEILLANDEPELTEEFQPIEVRQRDLRRSHEWNSFGDKEALCWAPWRVLKVDIFGRTQHCCGFFEKLPEFEWPTAATFHRETGLWNGAHSRYLRATMGKKDELSFCTFCKKDDRRHPGSADVKRRTSRESSEVFQRIYDENTLFEFKGTINDVEKPLPKWSTPHLKNSTSIIQPFKKQREFYRRLVRIWGFWDLGQVMQIGVRGGAMTPFLAEANDAVTVVDADKSKLDRCHSITKALELTNLDFEHLDIGNDTPFEERSFDGIWLDGTLLSPNGRNEMLQKLHRLLKRDGRLVVIGAHGVARIVKKASFAKTKKEADYYLKIIEEGPVYQGKDNFFNTASLLRQLRKDRFKLSTARPALSRFHGGVNNGSEEWTDYPALAKRLRVKKYREKLRDDPSQLDGLAERISFTATAM